QINRLWRDVGVSQIRGFANQHLLPPNAYGGPLLHPYFTCVYLCWMHELKRQTPPIRVLRSARPAACLVIGAGYRRKVTSKLKAQEGATFQRCPWSLDSTF